MSKQRSWTSKEEEILKKNYPSGGMDRIRELLPHRSYRSLTNKVGALGLYYKEPVQSSFGPPTKEPALSEIEEKVHKFISGSKPRTISEISEHVDKSEKTTLEILEGLKQKHYNVQIRPEDKQAMLLPEPEMGGQKLVMNVEKYFGSSREVVFGVISDLHYCNVHSREELIQLMYEKFKKEGITTVFEPGNMVDGEAPFNKYELMAWGIEGQIDYLIKHAPKVEGITTYFVTGDDHEGWLAKRVGLNIGELMQTRMEEAGRKDWKYLSHMEADVSFKTKEGATSVRIAHPGGGTAYAVSYTPQKIIESLSGGEKPCVFLCGHYHKLGHWLIRNVHTVLTGTMEDQTPFMRKRHIEAHVGAWIIRMTLGKDGAVLRFAPECFNFFDRKLYQVNRDFDVQQMSLTEQKLIESVKVF